MTCSVCGRPIAPMAIYWRNLDTLAVACGTVCASLDCLQQVASGRWVLVDPSQRRKVA